LKVRGGRARIVVTAAALLLLGLSAPSASALTRPRAGAIVSSPPLLNWTSVRGAVRYNVQLYRETRRGPRKVLSRFPRHSRYQVYWRWHYRGDLKHFTVARYFWYVWPWNGSRYGDLRVRRRFVHGRPPVNTSPPGLTGAAREGATLRALSGSWTGLPLPTLGFRWQRCAPGGLNCANLGVTASTYHVGAGDIDRVLRVVVIASNIARTVALPSGLSARVLAAPPNNVSRPAIAGHPHVGATLTASAGTWLSSRPVTYAYHWLRCSADGTSCGRISGAGGRIYQVRPADAAHRLAVVVRATNSGGTNQATAPRSGLVGLVIVGSDGADFLRGTLGSDYIRAQGGADTVRGGGGADRIFAGGGSDHVYGGAGADVITSTDLFRDWIDCGAGIDTVRADRLDRVSSTCEHVTRT
jgi:hemolysin type calcium-binding protein